MTMRAARTFGRAARGFSIAMLLAGCAGTVSPFGGAPSTPLPIITGRWMLSAPNAPPCGISLTGAAEARGGKAAPEGGCPGRFYLSRTWSLDRDTLTVLDDENQPLGQFEFAGGGFTGKSTEGTPMALARPPSLGN
jgi:hypothetical protein